jgi:hypothetical protein
VKDQRRCIAIDLLAHGETRAAEGQGHPQRLRSLTLTNCDVHDNWPPEALAPTRELVAQGHFKALGETS